MNSASTRQINYITPLPEAYSISESGNFQVPIDEIDAASLEVNPIF